MRMRTILLVVFGAALAIAVALYVIWGATYSIPEVTRNAVGGRWETESVRSLGGTAGGHTSLYRRTAIGRQQVGAIVFRETYVGDDCVIYATPRMCWIACDERRPLRIAEYCDTWEIVDGRFRTLDERRVEIRIDELKAKARVGK